MKKILLVISAFAIALATVPMFAAFEAHVVNVTAKVENALSVNASPIKFGSVYPQERRYSRIINIHPTSAFRNNPRLEWISYVIKQKPKPKVDRDEIIFPSTNPGGISAHEYCLNNAPQTYDAQSEYATYCFPSLCPYLSKEKVITDPVGEPQIENGPMNVPWEQREIHTEYGVTAFHDPSDPRFWASGWVRYYGQDWWRLDLAVPCFDGECAQDWPDFVRATSQNPEIDPANYVLPQSLRGQVFGCDIWIEVTGFESKPI
ncbi:MAG TPA: hypothetical protein VJG65_04150 [Patescibacteria group bacterium]|nr:hypothetical protein [Patescibacteria group bacterium]